MANNFLKWLNEPGSTDMLGMMGAGLLGASGAMPAGANRMALMAPMFSQAMQAKKQAQQFALTKELHELQKKQAQQALAQSTSKMDARAALFGGPDAQGIDWDQPHPMDAGQSEAMWAQAYPDLAGRQHFPMLPGGRAAAPIQNFAERQRLVKVYGKDSPEVARFDNYVRAAQIKDFGGYIGTVDPMKPGDPIGIVSKTLAPERTPETAGAVRTATGAAALRSEDIEKMPQRRKSIRAKVNKRPALERAATEIIDLAGSMWTSGKTGKIAELDPSSDQYLLNRKMKIMQSQVGLQELIAVKAQGATFGALSESELELLINSLATLDPHLPAEELQKSFDLIFELYDKGLQGEMSDFAEKYPDEPRPWEAGQGVGSTDAEQLKKKYGLE